MRPQDLPEIVRRSVKGDPQAFETLVKMFRQPAYRLAFRILGNEEEAKDSVQDSFIKIWNKIGTFDTSRDFIPWMYRIVVNTATDRHRVLNRHTLVPIDQAMPDHGALLSGSTSAAADNKELAAIIKDLTAVLPEKQRLVFILRDLEGIPSGEVEQITGMSETSVKSNLYYARKTVRESLLRIIKMERAAT